MKYVHLFTFFQTTGIPIESFARSQCNLIIRELSGFHSEVQRFSKQTLPMFWLEYVSCFYMYLFWIIVDHYYPFYFQHQTGIPDYVSNLMYFMVKLVPKYQFYFVGIILILGAVIIINNIRICLFQRRKRTNHNLKANAQYTFETEKFLKL